MTDKSKILEAFLQHAAFDGWNDACLKNVADDLDISILEIELAFPGGVADVASYYSRQITDQLIENKKKINFNELNIRGKISWSVMERMRIYSQHKDVSRSLARYYTVHPHIASKHIWQTADIIWQMAGDKSTDYNYYSKRSLLSGVVSSTFLFWLGDDSEDMVRTEEFLERRIADIMKINTAKAGVKEISENLKEKFLPRFLCN